MILKNEVLDVWLIRTLTQTILKPSSFWKEKYISVQNFLTWSHHMNGGTDCTFPWSDEFLIVRDTRRIRQWFDRSIIRFEDVNSMMHYLNCIIIKIWIKCETFKFIQAKIRRQCRIGSYCYKHSLSEIHHPQLI